jgi:hypothetical protein
MALFDAPKSENYPRKWREMSFDYKLMFVYHGCMMLLFATGGFFTTRQELMFVAVLVASLTTLSLRHRSQVGWRWQGVSNKQIFLALGGVVLVVVFLYAATPLFPPRNSQALPWYLAGLGIGLFNLLSAANLTRASEAQFLADCHEPVLSPETAPPIAPDHSSPAEPSWHRPIRAVYSVLFFAAWLSFVIFFYTDGVAIRDGSSTPTPTRIDFITEHGRDVYITPAQKLLHDRLQTASMLGIPLVLLSGAILHFLVGIKLFPNAPTLAEYLRRNSNPSPKS